MFDFTTAISERETEVVAQFKRAIDYLLHGRGRLDKPSPESFHMPGPDSQATITLLQDGTITATQDQDEVQGLFVLGIAYCQEPMQCGEVRNFPTDGLGGPEYYLELSLPAYLPDSTTAAIVKEMNKRMPANISGAPECQ